MSMGARAWLPNGLNIPTGRLAFSRDFVCYAMRVPRRSEGVAAISAVPITFDIHMIHVRHLTAAGIRLGNSPAQRINFLG